MVERKYKHFYKLVQLTQLFKKRKILFAHDNHLSSSAESLAILQSISSEHPDNIIIFATGQRKWTSAPRDEIWSCVAFVSCTVAVPQTCINLAGAGKGAVKGKLIAPRSSLFPWISNSILPILIFGKDFKALVTELAENRSQVDRSFKYLIEGHYE